MEPRRERKEETRWDRKDRGDAEPRRGQEGLERGGVGEACVCGLILEYVNVDDRLYVPVGD